MTEDSNSTCLSTLDVLDLDETVVDEKLEILIKKPDLSLRQLQILHVLIDYKRKISLDEQTECENDSVINFALKNLIEIHNASDDKFQLILKILISALDLNQEKIGTITEHIYQQLLSQISIDRKVLSDDDIQKCTAYLFIINQVACVLYKNGHRLDLKFIRQELNSLLGCQDKKINAFIFSHMIPNLVKCSGDCEILNTIFERITNQTDSNPNNILILCSLSDLYFPTKDGDWRNKLKSSIVENIQFWKLIHRGFHSTDDCAKKCASFLTKRAIDYVVNNEVRVEVFDSNDETPYISYEKCNKNGFKELWSKFFIIMEALEEKQFNLVNPALDLLKGIDALHPSWIYCIFKCALEHENSLVLLKTLKIVLKMKISNEYSSVFPFKQLLSVLNKIFVYDEFFGKAGNNLETLFHEFILHEGNFAGILQNMTRETFSPIPRFYVAYMLMTESQKKYSSQDHLDIMKAFLGDGIRYVTNNHFIEVGTQVCLLNFHIKHWSSCFDDKFLVELVMRYDCSSFYRNSKEWNSVTDMIRDSINNPDADERIKKMIYDNHLSRKMPTHNLTKLLILMIDAGQLSLDSYICLLNSKFDILKEFEKRMYASIDEFDNTFSFIVECFDNIKSSRDENDEFYREFIIFFLKQSDALARCFLWRFRNISVGQYDTADLYARSLTIILNHKPINVAVFATIRSCLMEGELMLNNKINYVGVKLLATMTRFMFENDSFTRNEKLNFVQSCLEMTSNISLLNPIDHKEISSFKGCVASSLYDCICEINYYRLSSMEWTNVDMSQINENILELLEKGGCLMWTVRVSGTVLPKLILKGHLNEARYLLNRMWKEIMQFRRNEQFRKCIKKFIMLLFNKEIYRVSDVQEICLEYGKRIFDLGELTPCAVYLLVDHINEHLNGYDLKPLYPLLIESVLYGSVLRKDQRIELDAIEYLSRSVLAHHKMDSIDCIVNPVNKMKVATLGIVLSQKNEFHLSLMWGLKEKINALCKSKHHYHTNSLNHRILLRGLQCTVLLAKITRFARDSEANVSWCVQMLSKHPHHTSVKILYEWMIASYIIHLKMPMCEIAERFNLSQLPQVSYFTIIYHVVKHQILTFQNHETENTDVWKNFEFAMNALLPFTMGQLFNVRLHAQYLSNKLCDVVENAENKIRFSFVNDIVAKNLLMYADEKNLKNVQSDFYINHFDIVHDLNIETIYYHIPRLTGISKDEFVSMSDAEMLDGHFEGTKSGTIRSLSPSYSFSNETSDWDMANSEIPGDNSVSIQKKFVPWKNMLLDMGIVTEEQCASKKSKLIVVASLIDRLPNLGGLSRTCEVFGVKQYVINSLRHLQDRQFQGLSVSSELWVDIIEVQPGNDLKKYLMEMKSSGYKVIGVEQTTSSVPLNEFRFPENTLLLLGHEKDGIPADLLFIADCCVEVPQAGVVRSLNVHVTASVFIWEYSVQHSFEIGR